MIRCEQQAITDRDVDWFGFADVETACLLTGQLDGGAVGSARDYSGVKNAFDLNRLTLLDAGRGANLTLTAIDYSII
jgi:hypothetical protein